MAALDALWAFQQADIEVDRFESELKGSKRRQLLIKLRTYLKEQQDALKKIEVDVEGFDKRVGELSVQQKQCDATIEELTRSIGDGTKDTASVRGMLSIVRTTAELLARAEQELERIQGQTAQMEKQQREIRSKANKAKGDYDRVKEAYDEELAKASGELEALRSAREEKRAQVDPELIKRYQSIKLQRTPPMALFVNDQCMGCNMSLPAVVQQSLRIPGKIVECENCGRILYLQ